MSTSDSGNDLRSDQYCVGEKRNEFEPVTYNFRVPEKKKSGLGVLSPPEWLLLDHTIAVVWSLFSNSSPSNLDIDDLKWAHEYLKEVRNNEGENPPDVRICLKEIQNRLISLYAKLTHEDNKKQEPTVETNAEQTLKMKESIKEVDNSAQKQSTLPKEERKTQQVQSTRESQASFKHTPKSAKKEESPRKATQKKEEEVILKQVFHRGTSGHLNSPLTTRKKSRQKENDTLSQDTLESVPNEGGKLSLQFKKWITEEDLNNEEQAYRKLKNEIRNLLKNPKISKDEVLKFLSNWREEQVLRLESELKRLNSIEQFMTSLKVGGFVPYLQDELPQNMEMIKKIKKIT